MREKIKEQKGAVTLFVVVACMFMITVLLLINIGIMNKNASEEKEMARINKNYAVGETDLLNSYNKIANENGYPNYEEVQNMIEEAVNKAKEETRTEMKEEVKNAKEEAKLEAFPVGSIYIGTTPTNPSDFIGGTWESYGQGRTLIGAGTGVDSNNNSQLFNAGTTGGTYKNKLTVAQLPSHNHTMTPTGTITSTFTGSTVNTSTIGNHSHTTVAQTVADGIFLDDSVLGWVANSRQGGAGATIGARSLTDRTIFFTIPSLSVNGGGSHNHSVTPAGTVTSRFTGSNTNTSLTGGGNEINNIEPYIVTYMWKRIS